MKPDDEAFAAFQHGDEKWRNLMRKLRTACLVILTIFLALMSSSGFAAAERTGQPSMLDRIQKIEEVLGASSTGTLLQRISSAEALIGGSAEGETVSERIEELEKQLGIAGSIGNHENSPDTPSAFETEVQAVTTEKSEAADTAARTTLKESEEEAETETALEESEEEAETETALEESEEDAAARTTLKEVVEGVVKTVLKEAVEEDTESVEDETDVTEAAAAQIEELGERPDFDPMKYVVLGKYKDLSVDVTKFEITDQDVEDEVNIDYELLVDEKDLFEKAEEGTIKEGDTVNIDYEGRIDGAVLDGGTGNYDLEIGSGSFIEGFEDQLIGVAVGDTVDLNVTFPEDYGAEYLAGKDAVFTVTANYIRTMPELTNELVSRMTDGEYTTIDSYREYERGKLTKDAEENQKAEANTGLMTQLYNTCKVESLPEDLVDYAVKQTKNQYIQMAQMYGMTYEDMVAMYGVDEETFLSYIHDDIEASLKQEIILKGIAAQENITISEAEYQKGAAKYAETYGMESVAAFESYYPRKEIEGSLLQNKTLDFVRENAVINEVEPENVQETGTRDLDRTDAETETGLPASFESEESDSEEGQSDGHNHKYKAGSVLNYDDFSIYSDHKPGRNVLDVVKKGDCALYFAEEGASGAEQLRTARGIDIGASSYDELIDAYGPGVEDVFDDKNDRCKQYFYDKGDRAAEKSFSENGIKKYVIYTFDNQAQIIFYIGKENVVREVLYYNDISYYKAPKATVQMVQESLNTRGYNCGKADGIYGSRTKNAILQYQSDHDLYESGNIDDHILKAFEKNPEEKDQKSDG